MRLYFANCRACIRQGLSHRSCRLMAALHKDQYHPILLRIIQQSTDCFECYFTDFRIAAFNRIYTLRHLPSFSANRIFEMENRQL